MPMPHGQHMPNASSQMQQPPKPQAQSQKKRSGKWAVAAFVLGIIGLACPLLNLFILFIR
jgi:hypothetical protein